MNRRKALLWSLLPVGSAPLRLLAQAPGARAAPLDDDTPSGGFRRAQDEPASRRPRATDDGLLHDDEPLPPPGSAVSAGGASVAPPADFPTEPGQVFRGIDISRYTSLPHENSNPQDAIIEWVFRATNSSEWHGDRVAVLCASRTQLRAYHTPAMLKRVEQMVERFTNPDPAASDFLKLRIQIVAAANPGWRYHVATRLVPIATGPQGQQIWSLDPETTQMVLTQMQVIQGFKLLEDKTFTIINGQTLNLRRGFEVDYYSGPQRESAAGLGFQPATSKLEEGVFLRISPLLTFEGDSLDVALDVQANTVKSLIPTRVLTRREIGPGDMTIDVPEVVETRVNRTVQGWRLGQSLVISAGIHPGILQPKNGWFNMRVPGTYPTKTEVLVVLRADLAPAPATARARDDRSRDR